jgi:hypothetical protein
VERIIPDPSVAEISFAIIEPDSHLDFANPVPFTDAQGIVIENGVLNEASRFQENSLEYCGRRLRDIKSRTFVKQILKFCSVFF